MIISVNILAILNHLPDVCSLQIVALTKKNRMLAKKCKENVDEGILSSKRITAYEGGLTNLTEEVLVTSPMQTKVSSSDVLLSYGKT